MYLHGAYVTAAYMHKWGIGELKVDPNSSFDVITQVLQT